MSMATVVISRKWHSPQIHVCHLNDGIEVKIAAADFAKAHLTEVNEKLPPWWKRILMTRTAWGVFLADVSARAFRAVTEEMKHSTVHAPPPRPGAEK